MAKMFVCSKTEPIVQTKAGKLRGFILDGTYTFHGIKYADAKRFQMPTEVEPWDGVKDALSYGFVSPMLSQDTPNGEVMVPHRYWPMDENCQYLNVWTQTLDQDAKKPVLLWLHGGGFAAGSSIEQQAYDGENMSKYGDAVVVSLNHRLNILGYLDLSPFGEKYANSGNAGNADMVAALRWIHDNIAAFGGDPENVTIFGQSGGGMKADFLKKEPIIVREEGSGTRKEMEHFLNKAGIDLGELKIVAQFNDPDSIKHSVSQGMGISIISKAAVEDYENFGLLLSFDLSGISMDRNLYVVSHKSNPLSFVGEVFLNFVKAFYDK